MGSRIVFSSARIDSLMRDFPKETSEYSMK